MMRRMKIGLLLFIGSILITSGAFLLSDTPAFAQGDDDRDYIGASECESCHRDLSRNHESSLHALALQRIDRDKDAILADFALGDAERSVQFPSEDAARPFTADDIAFAIGSGRYTQAYLYEVENNVYQVLPARWNTVTGAWESYPLASNWPDPAYDFVQNCAGCHAVGVNLERGRWEDAGVLCEACHGPGSEHEEVASDAGRRPNDEELLEIRASINPGTDPQVCGQCHSRGATAEGSPAYPIDYRPGGELLVDGAYTLYLPDDGVHGYPSGHASLPNMQFNEWYVTGHAAALTSLRDSGDAADECLSCHSGDYRYVQQLIAAAVAGDRPGTPPEALTIETAQLGITCITCHNPHSEDGRPANLVEESYTLCVSCHSNTGIESGIHHPVQEMFEGLRVVEEVMSRASDHFTAEDGPDCQTCHFPRVPVESTTRASHALMPLLPGAAINLEGVIDSCTVCHDAQVDAVSMQQLIDDIQASMRARIGAARARISTATPPWVITALDFVEGDGSYGIHNYAYADDLLDAVDTALGLFPSGEN
jgi:predicted CXXCH cytochrome family protein